MFDCSVVSTIISNALALPQIPNWVVQMMDPYTTNTFELWCMFKNPHLEAGERQGSYSDACFACCCARSHGDETEIESSTEKIDNISRAQRSEADEHCNEEHDLLYKDSGCSISTSQRHVPSHPHPSHYRTTSHGYASSHGRLCRSHIMCELIQCGSTAKA